MKKKQATETKHLAFFLPSLNGGGAEKITLKLVEKFVSDGYRCDILVAIKQGQLLHSTPSRAKLIIFDKKKTIHALFHLARYLRREKPDALMATVFTGNITAGIAHMLAGRQTRLVLREASLPERDAMAPTRIQTWLNRLVAKFAYGSADASIAVSNGVKENLIKLKLVPEKHIHVIPNPVDPKHLSADTIRRPERPLLVACGRLEPQKDYKTLITAFAEVRRSIDAQLIILGEGPLLASLECFAKDLNVNSHIRFEGFVHNPGTYMRKAAVFVHTATYEGFGGVVLEALANRCKIVATDCPGVCDVLDNGRYGALVPIGDVERIIEAILAILHGSLSFPSPEEHLRSYNPEAVCKRYISVLLPTTHQSN